MTASDTHSVADFYEREVLRPSAPGRFGRLPS